MTGNSLLAAEESSTLQPGWATDFGIAETKLQAPWSRPGTIARTALVEHLTTTPARVITVVGPAGYGKSTLLGQWAASTDRAVSWLSLDPSDNDPAVLLSYLVAILDTIQPADPALCRALLAEAAVDTSWLRPKSTRYLVAAIALDTENSPQQASSAKPETNFVRFIRLPPKKRPTRIPCPAARY
jgi:hypothetical protein